MRQRTFRTPVALGLEAAVPVGTALLASLGWSDSPPLLTRPQDAAPWACSLAACLLVAGLVARQRVTVDRTTVVIQNAVLRHRLARQDVASVRAGNYSGLLMLQSSLLHTLLITTHDGREVTAYGVVGGHAAVEARAAELRAALGLKRSPKGPRHAA